MMQCSRIQSLEPACRMCPIRMLDLLSEPCQKELNICHAPINVTKGFSEVSNRSHELRCSPLQRRQ